MDIYRCLVKYTGTLQARKRQSYPGMNALLCVLDTFWTPWQFPKVTALVHVHRNDHLMRDIVRPLL